MDVLAFVIGFAKKLCSAEMREEPQLDLRIVGVDEHVPFTGDEELPQFPAFLAADGDVL